MTIDVVSMDSNSCDLENLGAMADISGGTVTKVSASELTSNFAGILANPILASKVRWGRANQFSTLCVYYRYMRRGRKEQGRGGILTRAGGGGASARL